MLLGKAVVRGFLDQALYAIARHDSQDHAGLTDGLSGGSASMDEEDSWDKNGDLCSVDVEWVPIDLPVDTFRGPGIPSLRGGWAQGGSDVRSTAI